MQPVTTVGGGSAEVAGQRTRISRPVDGGAMEYVPDRLAVTGVGGPVEVVVGLLVLLGLAWWLWRRHAAKARPEISPTREAAEVGRHALRAAPRPAPAAEQSPRASSREVETSARPAARGSLFVYGGAAGKAWYRHDGVYAVIDVETTGFSPERGDRVIEIAIARVDAAGRVLDEYATLLNPQGRDTGPVFVHGITNEAVRDAPTFADVAGDILARLDGAVIVAHNASFEERFLAGEFARAGVVISPLPALCTLWLGQRTFDTPNHKLATLARHADIPLVDAHAALGDVRAVAALLPHMLARHGAPIRYGCAPMIGAHLVRWPAGLVRPKTRAVAMRKGADGWMASLVARLPLSGAEVVDADAAAYLDALSTVLEDGKIIGDEAKSLARLAGAAGFGAAQVAALNERFLESMREAALEDEVLTISELRDLNATAKVLGVPDYFDDLPPTGGSSLSVPVVAVKRSTAVAVQQPPAVQTAAKRRCGHCREVGHYRPTCPQLVEV
ncbi:PolC-type DNA polymerase III [Actinopolymorpha cephalotaxi]